jgi:hypothetical protein
MYDVEPHLLWPAVARCCIPAIHELKHPPDKVQTDACLLAQTFYICMLKPNADADGYIGLHNAEGSSRSIDDLSCCHAGAGWHTRSQLGELWANF